MEGFLTPAGCFDELRVERLRTANRGCQSDASARRVPGTLIQARIKKGLMGRSKGKLNKAIGGMISRRYMAGLRIKV